MKYGLLAGLVFTTASHASIDLKANEQPLPVTVDESIARWVLGEVEITDASFAQFGQDLNDAGLPAFMAFWQKILDGGNSK